MKKHDNNTVKRRVGNMTAWMLIICMLWSNLACLLPAAAEQTVSIRSASELLTLMNNASAWNRDYVLAGDIDLSEYTGSLKQAPIGSAQATAFTGTFDGQGHTISGLDFSKFSARASRIGLFGAINGAEIRNLTVRGTVSTATGQDAGGIVGVAYGNCVIENCVNYCDVSAKLNAGGIVGRTHNGPLGVRITNCINIGSVTSATKNAGGILGGTNKTEGPLTITQCINTGDITGATSVGGIVGLFNATPSSGSKPRAFLLSECLNNGTVTTTLAAGSAAYAGGIVGNYMHAEIRDSLNTGIVISEKGAQAVGGVLGGNEKDGGKVAYCLDRGSVYTGKQAHATIGQFIGKVAVAPAGPCFYTEITAGASAGAAYGNVSQYTKADFPKLNASKKWIETDAGPTLSFAQGRIPEIEKNETDAEHPQTYIAKALYNLGLVKGYDNTGSDFRLGNTLTRAEAIVQIVRFLGAEKTALAGTYTLPFDDVPSWAVPYIGYAYTNGITSGRSQTKFDPNAPIDNAQFLTLLLRVLGYNDKQGDFAWNDPYALAAKAGIVATEKIIFGYTRGDAFKACYNALQVQKKDGTAFADTLIQAGVFTKETFEKTVAEVEIRIEGDFVILVAGNWAANDFEQSQNAPEAVNQAVHARNQYMLDTYGVKIVTKDIVAANSTEGSGVGYDALYEAYLAGTSEYDAAMVGAQDVTSAAYKGFLHDLSDVPTLDLTTELWDQNILSDLKTYGKNFFATGDISYIDNASVRALFFSKTALEAAGLDSPYDLVDKNKWTFESYYQMLKDAACDVNQDGKFSAKDDRIGLLLDSANSLSMLNAAGERVADFVDEKLTLTFVNDRTKELYETYLSIVQTPGYALNYERDSTYSTGDANRMMKDGRALFWSRTMLNYRSLKNSGANFGVVPFPKYDSAQDAYYTRVDAYACQYLCIPETVESLSRSGKVLTLLAEQGSAANEEYQKDIATAPDGSFDERAYEMLDLIFDSTVYDFGAIKNPASVATLLQRLVYSGNTLTGVFEEKGEVANVVLDTMSRLYREADDTSVNKDFLRNFNKYEEWFEETTSKGIEENRKGDATVTVVDKNGKAVPNAKISVVQEDHEFRFGANLFMLDEMETEEKNELYKEYFKNTFNMATLPFYWNANEPVKGQTRYTVDSTEMYRRPPIDLCLEFCEENDIEPREHGLAYAHFFPTWFKNLTDKNEQYALLENRMKEIAALYADKIPTIEVTNETYRTNTGIEIYNDSDFLEWSFQTAQKYFPNNTLAINEGDHIWEAPTTQARYYRQIRDVLASGGRIDAIGMQFHILDSRHDRAWKSSEIFYNPKLTWETLNLYGSFDLPIQITEITIPAYSNDPEDEQMQAELLTRMYKLWFAHPNVEQIIYWNLVDGYAHGTTPGDMTAGENQYYGGLLRFDMSPKPAYYALKKLLDEEWHTEETMTADKKGNATFRGFYGTYTVQVEINGVVTTHTIDLSKGADNAFKLEV